MTATLAHPTPTATTAASAPRFDIYAAIHKGLRTFMGDTLSRLGRVDVADTESLARTLGQLEALLNFCVKHLQHENDFIHAALRARQPGSAIRTVDDHVEHLHSIAALRAESRAVLAAPDEQRPTLALRLYRHLSLFIAENLQHMHIEETANNAALWAHYSDAEIVEIHDRLVASISPEDTMETMRWMVPAVTPQERAAIVGDIQAHAPAEVLDAVIGVVRPHLEMRDWAKLALALGLPQQAGLVNFA